MKYSLAWVMVCLALTSPLNLWADDFPKPLNTEKSETNQTSPEDALKGISVPDGFQVTLFASEPEINQPIALATDDRGRLWVAENYTYSDRATNFDDSMRDRIVILEDVDGDGSFDQRTVFWDQGRRLTSVEIGYGGVWVLDAPNLLFIPDADQDDVPDGEPIVMLDGWDDDAARHTIVNGLRWGPDGWLYGRNGIMAISNVGIPGATPDQRVPMDCGIWRFHPTRHQFEVVAMGTTNPWGMDWDEHGQMFFINTVIGHLWHVVPGARFRRMYGEHFNPHTYGVIEQTADHFHWDTNELWHDIRKDGVTVMTQTTDQAGGGHAHCGMTILQGQPFPQTLQGSVLALNFHGRRINRDTLHRHGATYTARHAPDFLKVADPWFRGVEILTGKAGELFIADWSDVGECHENDGIHRTSGRIYRLALEENPPAARPAIGPASELSTQQLAEHVASPWEWLSRKCLLELGERAARSAIDPEIHQHLLAKFHSDESETQRLRRLWALHITGGASDDFLARCLDDPSEHVRCWAIQFLTEDAPPSPTVLAKFQSMAQSDDSGLVLTWLASALQRLRVEDRWPVALALGSHKKYADDRVLPLMVWYGVEPAVLANPEQAIEMVVSCQLPIVREYITRRVTLEMERQPEVIEQLLKRTAAPTTDSLVIVDVLRGMAEALRGWRKATPVAGWDSFSADNADSDNPEVQRLTRELSLVFGDGRALDELRKIALDSGSALSERRAAIRALVLARDAEVVPLLQSLLRDRDLSRDAINGLAAFGHEETPQLLVSNFSGFTLPAQRAAIATLVSRPPFASVLLDAVSAGSIDRSLVSAFQLRQMQNSGDAGLSQRVADLWPELAAQSQKKTTRIAALRAMLTPETLAKADTSAGRLLFNQSCANCHTLFGEGAKIAPDLTGAQRSNLNYLLENIVDPSATVSENFKLSVVLLDDGRVLNGVFIGRTEKTLTLQTALDQIVIQREEVEEMHESPVSMMPDELLSSLSDQQIQNMIAYLMSPAQVPLSPRRTSAE
ncbi:PVC-type heme-binding CxxCH protein [Rhodopirellula sp. P2]|uniref:PVC-type heme-binding CxxCH protein n=1 Tax=Rhodopirellula sp. P2 TaxID=2127060 RepID=UPI0023675A95|nr:PVC-type heme-binding CxxCH protein [Rhodopirellula sp. P2]WDQ16482.1 c-type cytochrome [Rhodopirellula sp. P2]